MNEIKIFPRVLIIYNSRINKADQHGVSIRGWFGDWPKEKLAQIYSGGEVGDESFCAFNFKLGPNERRLGKFFFKLKSSPIGQTSYIVPEGENLQRISLLSLFKNKISEWLINTGLWEIIFKPILSNELINYIESFKPQIIYCQGYSLTFSWLPIMIHKMFNIPICFQTGDDWPANLYVDSPLSFAIRPIVQGTVKTLLAASSARLVNGNLMAKLFNERYKISFEPVMMCDNLVRFRKSIPHRVFDKNVLTVIYTGGLAHGRWVSLVDLCKAAESINIDGFKIKVIALATIIPAEAVNTLGKVNNLFIQPGPSHEELPSYLKGANVLFLPETFDPVEAKVIGLSVSTKAHLYMMSERPILVYSSPITGVMQYAKEAGWGHTVQEQNENKLSEALHSLLTDDKYCKMLIENGIQVVLKNHDENNVRARFLSILNEIKKQI